MVVPLSKLASFVYAKGTTNIDASETSNVSKVDAIFANGSVTLLPWECKARPLVALIKLCLFLKKPLFTGGAASRAFALMCSSGLRHLDVIKAGSLDEAKELDPSFLNDTTSRKSTTRCFVDESTGDILKYSKLSRTWVPFGSCGLFKLSFKKDSLAQQKISKLDRPRQHPRAFSRHAQKPKSDPIFGAETGLGESTCHVVAKYMSHRAFNGIIGTDFLVPTDRSQWCFDEKANRRSSCPYKTLAENEFGPLVVELDKCWALNFQITERYPSTLLVREDDWRIFFTFSVFFSCISSLDS